MTISMILCVSFVSGGLFTDKFRLMSKPCFLMMTLTIFGFLNFQGNCFSNSNARVIDKIGRHFDKIKDIDWQLSLNKTEPLPASEKMMEQVAALQKLNLKVSENEPIKVALNEFLTKWATREFIYQSLINNDQKFMADVTSFYLRGLVKYKKGWKTLFPFFRA